VERVLRDKLAASGRLQWATEEMQWLEAVETYDQDSSEAWRRVPGRGSLSGSQLTVLKELARWREETAAERNIPRGWVIKDVTLVEIARRRPDSMRNLVRVRGMNPKEANRSGDEILASIDAGRRAPAVEVEPVPGKQELVRARLVSGLADAVVRARSERAGIASELVATRAEIERLLMHRFSGHAGSEDGRHRLLHGWRRELAGDAVLALAEGKMALRTITEPPFVEEVEL
jgi:ribonuclease D